MKSVAGPEPTQEDVARALFETEQATEAAAKTACRRELMVAENPPRARATLQRLYYVLIGAGATLLLWGVARILLRIK